MSKYKITRDFYSVFLKDYCEHKDVEYSHNIFFRDEYFETNGEFFLNDSYNRVVNVYDKENKTTKYYNRVEEFICNLFILELYLRDKRDKPLLSFMDYRLVIFFLELESYTKSDMLDCIIATVKKDSVSRIARCIVATRTVLSADVSELLDGMFAFEGIYFASSKFIMEHKEEIIKEILKFPNFKRLNEYYEIERFFDMALKSPDYKGNILNEDRVDFLAECYLKFYFRAIMDYSKSRRLNLYTELKAMNRLNIEEFKTEIVEALSKEKFHLTVL